MSGRVVRFFPRDHTVLGEYSEGSWFGELYLFVPDTVEDTCARS